MKRVRLFGVVVYGMLFLLSAKTIEAGGKNKQGELETHQAVLWRFPGNIRSRDLFNGPGGIEHRPKKPFTFIKEDMGGSSPKFEIHDAKGIKWRVKLGQEVKPETAATRLLWAVGYFVDEIYFVPQLTVNGLKALNRGQDRISGGAVREASLERRDPRRRKLGQWQWKENPFIGTKQFDGLRVLMALINNWDLKTSNNAIYHVGDEDRYEVSDLGGTFGRTGSSFTRTKSDVEGYSQSPFINQVSVKGVDFHLDSRPFFLAALYWPYYQERAEMESIVQHIPLPHVKWIAYQLNQLSDAQLEAIFQAAGYPVEKSRAFVAALERRIGQLSRISEARCYQPAHPRP
jgi:hypothetical protein